MSDTLAALLRAHLDRVRRMDLPAEEAERRAEEWRAILGFVHQQAREGGAIAPLQPVPPKKPPILRRF